jgi:HEAT repeat protein
MRWRFAMLGLLAASSVNAQDGNNDWAADEAILREQKLPTKGAELLQILRERTPSPETAEQFRKNVARLKAAPYGQRVKATDELVKMGSLIRPLLESMLWDSKLDPETDSRLRLVLEHFPAEKDIAVVTSAARLLQRDKPASGLPVLLEFVPHAANESVRQEVQRAINAMALAGKEPAPLLVESLKVANPARRAAAAEALVRIAGPIAKDKIEPLIKDPHPQVRYQIGLALVERNDKAGLPLLIRAIAEMPPDAVEFALDLLYRAAGDTAPTVSYDGKKNAGTCSAAWAKWHDKHQATLDLAKQLAKSDLGLTIITSTMLGVKGVKANTNSQIFELGPGNTRRWEFEGPRYPLDLQIIGPDRLLVAEYLDNRVTERDFKGKVLKTFTAPLATGCQRLTSGQTLIVSRQILKIVDREGKETFSWAPQPFNITAGYGLRNGQVAVATSDGRCRLLDPQGRELKSMQIGPIYVMGGSIEVLPNGRVLAPLYSQNMVAELDWTGAKLWQAQVTRPTSATRLPNGNTLVSCGMTMPGRVLEIDKNGKELWNLAVEGRYVRARRR